MEALIKKASSSPDWSEVPVLEAANILWLPDTGIRMYQQVCYDESGLYVHQSAVEKEIRAENAGPVDQICEDSCMEFFFSPMEGDIRYFNLEINPLCNAYVGFRTGRKEAVRLLLKNAKDTFDIRCDRTDNGWELYYKVPIDFLRLFYPGYELKSGNVIMANFFKCGDLTETPHYLSWNPISSETPDFHRPQDFGRMVLE